MPKSLFQLIREAPYRGLFLGESLQGFAVAAIATGMIINVASSTGNAALAVGVSAAISVAALVVSPLVTPTLARYTFFQSLVWTYLVAAAVLLLASPLFFLNIGTLPLSFALMLFLGAVNSFHTPALYATLDWFVGKENLPRAISSVNLRAGIGWVIGPIIGGLLAGVSNGAILMFIVAAAYVAATLPYLANRALFAQRQAELRARMVSDPDCVDQAVEDGVVAYAGHNPCQCMQAPVTSSWSFLTVLRIPRLAFAIAIFIAIYFFLGAFTSLMTPWSIIDLGLAKMMAGIVITVRSIASLPGVVVITPIQERIGMGRTLVLSSIVLCIAALAAGLSSNWGVMAAIAVAIFGLIFYPLVNSLLQSLITIVFGEEYRVPGQTLIAFSKGVVAIAYLAVGVLADRIGINVAFMITVVIGTFVILGMRFITRSRWNDVMQTYNNNVSTLAR
jgi:MFS family permease